MMKLMVALLFLIVTVNGASENFLEKNPNRKNLKRFGPNIEPTVGQPWPKPQLMKNYGEGFMIIRPKLFRFEIARHTCDIIEEALKRYYTMMLEANYQTKLFLGLTNEDNKDALLANKTWKGNKNFDGYLDVLKIDLLNPCEEYPHDEMEEAYELKIDTTDHPGAGFLASPTNWGILRGLETFLQLIHPTKDFTALQVKNTLILDFPRFPFRAILLDTSRHFLSKKAILGNLDLMSMNKFNVFHWHIVDDQAFPYMSKEFPELSFQGAYHPYTHVYTQQDVRDIIEYARLRGIRVVPEFDTPGHTLAWGPGQPDFLTKCCDHEGEPDGTYGPIDVSNPANYEFLRTFFQDIANVFPDKYLHLGGDEVDDRCWKSNPNITEFMEQRNYSTYQQLEGYHMQQLINIIKTFQQNNSYLVWQEVFDNARVQLPRDTIVHIWKGNSLAEELHNVTRDGFRALLYSCWYLNYISYGIDWHEYYACDPHNFPGTDAQKRLVFGGGAAMWGEHVDSTNLIPRLWPRAAVVAERLWSNAKVNDTKEAQVRLEEHRCRLLQRGYNVEPVNGPGYCMVSWD